jgi:hypothetical protein
MEEPPPRSASATSFDIPAQIRKSDFVVPGAP